MGFIVVYRQLVSTSEVKSREEAIPIHTADVACMTVAPSHDSDAPDVQQPKIFISHDRRAGALNLPSRSFHLPNWNLQGRLAREIPAEKRSRLSQGQEIQNNLQSEFVTPSKRRGRKSKSSVNAVISPCLQLFRSQSYTEALRSPEIISSWKVSIAAELHRLGVKRKFWEVVLCCEHNLLRCRFVFK